MSEEELYRNYKFEILSNLKKEHIKDKCYQRPEYSLIVRSNMKSKSELLNAANAMTKLSDELSAINDLVLNLCNYFLSMSATDNKTQIFNNVSTRDYSPCSDEERELKDNKSDTSSNDDDFDIYSHFGIDPDDEFASSILESCMSK